MNFVDQIVSAVEVSAKSALSVCLACVALLIVVYFFPLQFVDLPLWILPVVRMMAIFSGVLVALYILQTLWSKTMQRARITFKRLTIPGKIKRIKSANLDEILVLCEALSKDDRDIRLKPDQLVTLRLLDKGLIESYWNGVMYFDGLSSYQVPMDVWRLLLKLAEFQTFDKIGFREARRTGNEAELRASLPQGLPAISGASLKTTSR